MSSTTIERGHPEVLVHQAHHTPAERRTRARQRRFVELALAVGVPAILIALWQVASSQGWVDTRFYPAPSTIVTAAWDLTADGRLIDDIAASTRRILAGYLLGALSGYAVGTAMGTIRIVRKAFEPLLEALYVVPKLAMLPVFLTMFGLGEAPQIALVVVTVFFFLWIETMESMAKVPDGYREAARSFGVGPVQMFRHVLFPATLPQVFVALRLSMGVAVLVVVASEFLIGGDGLGYLIFNSRALLLMSWSYVGIVVVALLGVALAGVVGFIGRQLTPWQPRGR